MSKFWSTLPINTYDPSWDGSNPEPYKLPTQFKWDTLNPNNEGELDDLYMLLKENYIGDVCKMNVTKDLLKWTLTQPGWNQELLLCVRVSENNKLVAFVSATPIKMRVGDNVVDSALANFLCIHRKIRNKRLTPLLSKELIRRLFDLEIKTCVGVIPNFKIESTCNLAYWHRKLNVKKLDKLGLLKQGTNISIEKAEKKYKVPTSLSIPGIRRMRGYDVDAVYRLLNNTKALLTPLFTREQIRHLFLDINVVRTYVVEKGTTSPSDPFLHCVETGDVITDIVSFYFVESIVSTGTIISAFSFYNISTSTPIKELIKESFVLAYASGADIYTCLDIYDTDMLEELKFGKGSGVISYYMLNYDLPKLKTEQVENLRFPS
jgi:glycylpeptide N-tetradecanoyltransferase